MKQTGTDANRPGIEKEELIDILTSVSFVSMRMASVLRSLAGLVRVTKGEEKECTASKTKQES